MVVFASHLLTDRAKADLDTRQPGSLVFAADGTIVSGRTRR
jgi:hypothetical protein